MKFIVRDLIKEDLPTLYEYISDHEIANLTNYDVYEPYENFEAKYQSYINGNFEDIKIFSIVLDKDVIGKIEIGYDMVNKTGAFEIIIGDKTWWGRGLGVKALNVLFSYAFNNLGLNRISCEVYKFNERSIRLMRKMHMHVDGMLREAEIVRGRYTDVFVFSLLRKEYEGDVYND